jgi:hypothetical protein
VTIVLFAAWMSLAAGSARVPEGNWGGTGIAIEVTASGARIELDCARGTIDAPLTLDADGKFDLSGSLVFERPGPVREGAPDRKQSVRYQGRLEGETLTLLVVSPQASRPPNPLSAVRGKTPRLRKCG